MCTHACQAAPPADGAPAPVAEKKADAPPAAEKKADAPAGDEAPKPKKKKKVHTLPHLHTLPHDRPAHSLTLV